MLSSECQLLNERADSLISQKDEKIRGLEVIVENSRKQIENDQIWYSNALAVKEDETKQREVFILFLEILRVHLFMF